MKDYFDIGEIVNTQGIKGDVRVVPWTDDPKRFELLNSVTVFFKKDYKTYDIERVWYHKKFVILKLNGINDMTAGSNLRGGVIRISADMALPLGVDEYYIRDLYGIEVFYDSENLGVIVDVIQTGANDVYIIRDKSGREILIPAIKQCIIDINMSEKRMQVKLLEGMRE